MDYIKQLDENIKLRQKESKISVIIPIILILAIITAVISYIGIFFINVLLIIYAAYLLDFSHKRYVKRKVKFYAIIYNMLKEQDCNKSTLNLLKENIKELKKRTRKFLTIMEIIGTGIPVLTVVIAISTLNEYVSPSYYHKSFDFITITHITVMILVSMVVFILCYVLETYLATQIWVRINIKEKKIIKIISDIFQYKHLIDKEVECNIDMKNKNMGDLLIIILTVFSLGFICLYEAYYLGKGYLKYMYMVEDKLFDIIKNDEKFNNTNV